MTQPERIHSCWVSLTVLASCDEMCRNAPTRINETRDEMCLNDPTRILACMLHDSEYDRSATAEPRHGADPNMNECMDV